MSGTNNAKKEFKVAIILLMLTVFLLVQTLNFPMSGSYGGVENQWYVSPALFPLFVLTLLLFCSLILLVKSCKGQGYQHFISLEHWLGNLAEQNIRDRWLVIALLSIYAFVYIPSADFYLVTCVFLMSLLMHFYTPVKRSYFWVVGLNFLLAIVLFSLKYQAISDELTLLSVTQDETLITHSDIAVTVTLSMSALVLFFCRQVRTGKTLAIALFVSLFMPLILVCIFSYLLFVPMPVEYGSVVMMLDHLVYDVIMQ